MFQTELTGQIQYDTTGLIYPKEVEEIEFMPAMTLLENVQDTLVSEIMLAFRFTDIQKIYQHLSPKLKEKTNEIDSLFKINELKFQNADSVYLFESTNGYYSTSGYIGQTYFTHPRINPLTIKYRYFKDHNSILINQIEINNTLYPNEILEIERIQNRLKTRKLSSKEEFELQFQLVDLISPNEGEDKNDFYLPISDFELSYHYGKLSWLSLKVNENELAVKSAQRGLEYSSKNKWINANLALGLSQLDRFSEASALYVQYMHQYFEQKPAIDIFKSDILELESEGIEVINRSKIFNLLNGKKK